MGFLPRTPQRIHQEASQTCQGRSTRLLTTRFPGFTKKQVKTVPIPPHSAPYHHLGGATFCWLCHIPQAPLQILSNHIQQLKAYTLDHGFRLPALRCADKTLSDTSYSQSGRLQPGTLTSAANLSVITSLHVPSPALGDCNHSVNMSAVTTASQCQLEPPRLAPPSISQLPSSYLLTSSPAPFWKYVQFKSTLAKPDGFSPLKDLTLSSSPCSLSIVLSTLDSSRTQLEVHCTGRSA
jgi:hypothetical protein